MAAQNGATAKVSPANVSALENLIVIIFVTFVGSTGSAVPAIPIQLNEER
jgi:hypothetical protein